MEFNETEVPYHDHTTSPPRHFRNGSSVFYTSISTFTTPTACRMRSTTQTPSSIYHFTSKFG